MQVLFPADIVVHCGKPIFSYYGSLILGAQIMHINEGKGKLALSNFYSPLPFLLLNNSMFSFLHFLSTTTTFFLFSFHHPPPTLHFYHCCLFFFPSLSLLQISRSRIEIVFFFLQWTMKAEGNRTCILTLWLSDVAGYEYFSQLLVYTT